MGLVDKLRTPNIPGGMTFILTPLGKNKVDEFTGDKDSRVIVALDEMGGTGTATDISNQAGMGRRDVERTLWRARKRGLVRIIRGED